MKRFYCSCGQLIFFENPQCLNCGRPLGFIPDQHILCAFEPDAQKPTRWRPLLDTAAERRFRMCTNYENENVCNWMVPDEDPESLCIACRLNDIIPNLSEAQHRVYWARLETAKRRLVYSLIALGLPIVSKQQDPETGLAFRFLADSTDEDPKSEPVMTGHEYGTITINLAEADDATREQVRSNMNEPYRTLLGHFRHEIGHYYWERLIRDTEHLTGFREYFGDEQENYTESLNQSYQQGPPQDWPQRFISAYAASHPWEDWAETWAHYLHMVDTLETAIAFDLTTPAPDTMPSPTALLPQVPTAFEDMLAQWIPLTYAINSINRSMGLPDAYPFVLSTPAVDKLRFVHAMIGQARAKAKSSRQDSKPV